MIAGVETGGTKIVCGVADPASPDEPVLVRRFPTTTPEQTIDRIAAFLAEAGPVDAVGVASFGPVDADPASPRFGWITDTPKAGWSNTDLRRAIAAAAGGVPAAFVSDVTGAAVGELRSGAGRGAGGLAYATIGTGIGVGLVVDGRPLGGNGWPELGHLLVRRHPADAFVGACPFHADCLEGLASGPAVHARWGMDASSFPPEVRFERIDVLASYVAQLAWSVAITVGVDRMVLGGGVMQSPGLLDATRGMLPVIAAGYGPPQIGPDLLVPPALEDSGLVGALHLAADLL